MTLCKSFHRSDKVVIDLIGCINKCGIDSYRFDVVVGGIEQNAVDILPSRQFGHLVMTTPYGIVCHFEANRKNTSGQIKIICWFQVATMK